MAGDIEDRRATVEGFEKSNFGQGVGSIFRGPEFTRHEKEAYAIVMMESLINLGRTATRDGLGEYYEDTIDDMLDNIPTYEYVNPAYRPDKALMELIEFYARYLDEMGVKGILPPRGDKEDDGTQHPTYFDILCWLERLHPSDWNTNAASAKTNPVFGLMNRVRTRLKKRLALDLGEDMGLWRHRVWQSSQEDKEYEEYFKDYRVRRDAAGGQGGGAVPE